MTVYKKVRGEDISIFINGVLIESKAILRKLIAGHVDEYLARGGRIGIYTAIDNAGQDYMKPMTQAERNKYLKSVTYREGKKA